MSMQSTSTVNSSMMKPVNMSWFVADGGQNVLQRCDNWVL